MVWVQDRERRQQASRAGARGGAGDAADDDLSDAADLLGCGVDVRECGDSAVCQRFATGLHDELCGWGSLCPRGTGQLLEAEAGGEEGGTDPWHGVRMMHTVD